MARVVKGEFKSVGEFLNYISSTPFNSIFKDRNTVSDIKYQPGFHKTKTYEEALYLMKHGWDDMAKNLEKKFTHISANIGQKTVNRMVYDVAGFQASVPRYLQGVPTSMINKKPVIQKQKVVTIVKHIGYLADVNEATIVENSIKALQIVKQIESQGYRVNLDVISPAGIYSEISVCRIRIKSANERLNISKAAFALVHPDMLRRLVFRFREVSDLKSRGWMGMGSTIYSREEAKSYLNKGEYYIHNFIEDVEQEVRNMGV